MQPLQLYFGTPLRIDAIEEELIRNNGREDNGLGGFGGMHGYMVASLATKKGLEPMDVSEAIVAARRRNVSRNAKNIFAGSYIKRIPLYFAERVVRGVPGAVKSLFSSRLSDREKAGKLVSEAIEYNTVEFN